MSTHNIVVIFRDADGKNGSKIAKNISEGIDHAMKIKDSWTSVKVTDLMTNTVTAFESFCGTVLTNIDN